MKNKDFYWLVGLLEGEGSFGFYQYTPRISLNMKDEDVVQRAASLMGGLAGKCIPPQKPSHSIMWHTGVCGIKAIKIMEDVLPEMGIRRRAKIIEVLKKSSERRGVATGERHGSVKLKAEYIPIIKELNRRGISKKMLAEMCGVVEQTIRSVVTGRTWKHIL